jgi:hypothetical protein
MAGNSATTWAISGASMWQDSQLDFDSGSCLRSAGRDLPAGWQERKVGTPLTAGARNVSGVAQQAGSFQRACAFTASVTLGRR